MRPLLLLLLGSLLLQGCSDSGTSARQPEAPEAVPVTVAAVVQKAVPLQVRAIGTVEAYSTVSIKSRVSGQVTGVYFREGQDVKKGDRLFTIDRRPLEAALRQAEANLARDVAQAKDAEDQARRYASLFEQGIVARQQYDQLRASADALRAAVQADRAAVENARVQLGYTTIASPIDGRAGDLVVAPGNLAKADDTTALVVLNQITPIYVSFAVPEQSLPAIKTYMAAGQLPVEAIVPGDQAEPLRGVLTFVNNAVDSATGTIRLKGTFRNRDRRLWPGQFVNVVLTLTTQPDARVVPSQAVQTGQQGPYVFVVRADLTAESRPVVVERTIDGEAVIGKGLKPGERVVTDGQLRLVPGARVNVKEGPQGASETRS